MSENMNVIGKRAFDTSLGKACNVVDVIKEGDRLLYVVEYDNGETSRLTHSDIVVYADGFEKA